MYITTSEKLEQTPTLSGVVGGMLGEPLALKKLLLEFRTKVHERPQDFKKLLLVARLHPFPSSSWVINQYPVTPKQLLVDVALMVSEPGEDVRAQVGDELWRISNRFEKTNADFRQQIEAEKQLWDKTTKTIQELLRQKAMLKQHKLLLLEAALLNPKQLQRNPEALGMEFFSLGSKFAAQALPSVGPYLINSDASDAHLARLGWVLTRYAHAVQEKDRTFQKEVAQERQKRKQAEQERQRRRRRGRRQ